MTSLEIGAITIAVLASAVFVAVGVIAGRFSRDRIFAGLTPGLVPATGQEAPVVRVKPGREYSGEVAVAFAPPRGLAPGLVGTIVDGHAEMRDLTATIVDLAVRGWVTIEAVDANEARQKDPKRKARDWRVTPVAERPKADRLTRFEGDLLTSLTSVAGAQSGVLMSVWTRQRSGDLRSAQNDLYAQSVEYGWYDKDPRPRSRGCLVVLGWAVLIGWNLLMLAASFSVWTLLGAVLMLGTAVFATRRLKHRVPRTAIGTATMIQALGFKKYLATAEADQFSFEEAAGIFSRYLPYALVFGVAQHWAKVFGDVAKRSHDVGGPDVLDGLLWIDLGADVAYSLALAADGFGGIFEMGDLVDGIGGLGEGLGGFVEGVGDFVSGIDLDLDF